MALGPEMINFIGLQLIDQLHEIHRIREVAVVKKQPDAVDMGVLVEVVDPAGVECARAADDPVDFVTFGRAGGRPGRSRPDQLFL